MNRCSKIGKVSGLLAVMITGLVIFSTPDKNNYNSFKVDAQLNTQIDKTSDRDTFEYFLSDLVDNDTDTIMHRFERYNQQLESSERLETALLGKYMRYKAALATLKRDNNLNVDFQDLHQQMLLLQRAFFTVDEQYHLFSEENLLRELALLKKGIKESAQSSEEFQQRWEFELNKLPPVLRNSFRNASLLAALNETNILDTQSQFIAREALVGSEAAERLRILDQQRTDFDRHVHSYLITRDVILNNASFDDIEKEQAITDLRKSLFDNSLWRRIEALERIHDR